MQYISNGMKKILKSYIALSSYVYRVGPRISQILFGIVTCLFSLTNNFNLINLSEVLSLNVIRMKWLITLRKCLLTLRSLMSKSMLGHYAHMHWGGGYIIIPFTRKRGNLNIEFLKIMQFFL